MRQLTKYAYEGHDIQFDVVDGKVMANATAMCNTFGKRTSHWLELETAKKYIKAIAVKDGISEDQLVNSKPGSTINGGGKQRHSNDYGSRQTYKFWPVQTLQTSS